MANEDHDQRFKELIKRFPGQLVSLFFPQIAQCFRFDRIDWLEKEVFPDPPKGKRRGLDLVGKVPVADGFRLSTDREGQEQASIALFHVEVESDQSSVPIRKRIHEYYEYLRNKHDLPVLPFVLFLKVGLDGIGWETYQEGLYVNIISTDSALETEIRIVEEDLVGFRFPYVGLPSLPGSEYLDKDEVLAVALSALMKIQDDDRVRHELQGMKRIAESGESQLDRFLLAECLHSYIGGDEEHWDKLQKALTEPKYQGVREMTFNIFETKLKEGRLETRHTDLIRLIEKKYPGHSITTAAAIIRAEKDLDVLAAWLDALCLAADWDDFLNRCGWKDGLKLSSTLSESPAS